MADFKKLQLDGEDISPVTHEAAVLNDDNESIAVSYQIVEDDNLNTDDKSIVGAINEVSAYGIRMNDLSDVIEPGDPNNPILTRIEELENTLVEYIINNPIGEDSNEGKQLIATAIGEPLNAEDTFAAMSDDIKGLLSTFKTNMMNNGVTVESSDKFKSLIDKIATMVEEGEGKGIQFAEGSGSWKLENDSYSSQSVTITTNLNFTPTYVFVYGEYAQVSGSMMMMGNASLSIDNIIVSNLGAIGSSGDTTLGQLSISDITANSFTLKTSVANYYKISATKWFAIGVGEEDTTLRDSLASILQDEGVDVTDEDNMASLITKVDEEFDNKNANSGLDIISATELPATGKENQICVITDTPVDNYVITSNLNYNANEDSITLYNVSDSTSMTPIVISSNGVTSYNYISQVCQGSTTLASYVYSTGQWIPLTSASYYLLKDGTLVTGPMLDKFGTFTVAYTAGTGLLVSLNSSSYYANIITCNKSVDFSSLNFSKIKVTAYTTNAQLTPYLYVVSSNQMGQLRSSLMSDIEIYFYEYSSTHASYGATKHTYELDINWSSQTGYLGIGGLWSGASSGTLYITDIEFE